MTSWHECPERDRLTGDVCSDGPCMDDNGTISLALEEYSTRIVFCPFCGVKLEPKHFNVAWEDVQRIAQHHSGLVHVLVAGRALCGQEGAPHEWPPDHRWTSRDRLYEATCTDCKKRASP